MTNLSIFAFEGQQVSFVGTGEQPEWIAADVCFYIGSEHFRSHQRTEDRSGSGLDSDEKGIVIVDTPGGEQVQAYSD